MLRITSDTRYSSSFWVIIWSPYPPSCEIVMAQISRALPLEHELTVNCFFSPNHVRPIVRYDSNSSSAWARDKLEESWLHIRRGTRRPKAELWVLCCSAHIVAHELLWNIVDDSQYEPRKRRKISIKVVLNPPNNLLQAKQQNVLHISISCFQHIQSCKLPTSRQPCTL